MTSANKNLKKKILLSKAAINHCIFSHPVKGAIINPAEIGCILRGPSYIKVDPRVMELILCQSQFQTGLGEMQYTIPAALSQSSNQLLFD